MSDIVLSYEHKTRCPKCASNGRDTSGDNLHVYGNDTDGKHKGAHCFTCGFTIVDYHRQVKNEGYELVGKPFTEDVKYRIKNMSTDPDGWRGLRKDTCNFYRVRHEYDNKGELISQYYPETENYELSGYKLRILPKDFDSYGTTGKNCELFGQFQFRNSNSKTVIITAGEIDCLSVFQMLQDYQKSRGNDVYEPIPVVTSTIGEGGTAKQIALQYEWLNRFEKIILCLDNDDAGREATGACIEALPRGKVYQLDMTLKDPNEYLTKGREREFISAYFSAKQIVPTGVIGSDELYEKVIENSLTEYIPLPPFMEELSEMTGGGFPLGYIINFAAGSGCVDKDTEFLTPTGWKSIGEYAQGDMVAQYHVDKSISFVQPKEYVKLPCNTLTHIKNRSVDQVLSDEHRIVYYATKNSSKPRIISLKEMLEKHNSNSCGFRGFIANTFHYSGNGIDLNEGELRLQVAVMADGRIVKEGKNNYTQMRFGKKRKYDRLIEMCEKFNLPYKDNGEKFSDKYSSGVEYEIIVWPVRSDKNFTFDYYNCTNEQLKIICDEVLHWDGYLKNNTYTSCRRGDVDFIQFAFSATGRRAVVGEDSRIHKYNGGYCGVVNVNKKCQFTSIQKSNNSKPEISEYKTLDGYKYCFVVDTGMLVLRRGGRIFITGNSGKTTIVNELIYYWIFNSPHHIGVVSLELEAGQYGESMLSRHLGRKIALIRDPRERLRFVQSETVQLKSRELFQDEDGKPRWHLLDDRDGNLGSVQQTIEQLIISCKCRVIILDPLQDLLDGLSNEDQSIFMRWQKSIVKRYKITFVNISHVRKNQAGQQANSTGAFLSEEDMSGSSTIFKSGGANILFGRNKYAEDPIERNTIRAVMSKCRWTGFTGPAGEWYYDNMTHTMMNKELWVERNNHIPDDAPEIFQYDEDDEYGDGGVIEVDGIQFSID